jgi:hypothetical protein
MLAKHAKKYKHGVVSSYAMAVANLQLGEMLYYLVQAVLLEEYLAVTKLKKLTKQ